MLHSSWTVAPPALTDRGSAHEQWQHTDGPHTTPPGADNQDGTVIGVLDGGPAILDALGIDRTD